MESKGMTQQEFSQFLEMSPASLSSIFTGRTNPTLNVVESIKKKFENINLEWLMFGNGSMFMNQTEGDDTDGSFNSEESAEAMTDGKNTSEYNPDLQYRNSDAYDNARTSVYRDFPKNPNSMPNNAVMTEMKYFNNNRRKIKEIRVFYDDQTYESFVPKE